MKFDDQGHAVISPQDLAGRVRSPADHTKLAYDILFPSTPHVFDSYEIYRKFLIQIADGLSVHPSNISVRGSSKFGFSTTPRSAKVWVQMHSGSDIDLAIIDPDLFHLLDNDFRRWERDVKRDADLFKKNFQRLRKLAENRQHHYFRDDNLISTPWVNGYRDVMRAACDFFQPMRDVKAFFYRDWWSLQAKQEKDLHDLLSGMNRNLPEAGKEPRPRLGPLTDADLPSHSGAEELVLSEMEEITDSGLAHLQNMNKLERLWLDDLNITDAGLAHLAGLVQLKSLSVDLLANEWNDRKGLITDAGLAHLADLTNLERLHVAGDGITDKGLEHLANLKSLRNVSIASANITQSGITELRRQLPEVKVDCRRLGRRKSRD